MPHAVISAAGRCRSHRKLGESSEVAQAMKKKRRIEALLIHGGFLLLGLVTVGFVLLITVYLVIAGLPALRRIGLTDFLFGNGLGIRRNDRAHRSEFLPFLLTSVYGTAGAIALGVPVGFLTAVYLSKVARPKVAGGHADGDEPAGRAFPRSYTVWWA